jgi:hypothetical protein
MSNSASNTLQPSRTFSTNPYIFLPPVFLYKMASSRVTAILFVIHIMKNMSALFSGNKEKKKKFFVFLWFLCFGCLS